MLSWVLIGVGLAVLVYQSVQHIQAARKGPLKPFDEDGERVFLPAIGTIATGGGLFLLVLGSGRDKR